MCDKEGRWYKKMICLDIVWYMLISFNRGVIYIVYDIDDKSDEINQKRQMQKLPKDSMITYIMGGIFWCIWVCFFP